MRDVEMAVETFERHPEAGRLNRRAFIAGWLLRLAGAPLPYPGGGTVQAESARLGHRMAGTPSAARDRRAGDQE